MELVTSDVRGYKNKVRNRMRNGEDFYRSAKSMLGGRIHKKLTAKTTWYRKRKSSDNDTEIETFAGLNANGLPDEPLRKRKRSEDDQQSHTDGQQHHHLHGVGVTKDKEAGIGHGSAASKDPIRIVRSGRVDKGTNKPNKTPETKL